MTHELSHESAHENADGSVHEDVHGKCPRRLRFFLCRTNQRVPRRLPTRVLTRKISSANFSIILNHTGACAPGNKNKPPKTPAISKQTTIGSSWMIKSYSQKKKNKKKTPQKTKILFEYVAENCLHVWVGVVLGMILTLDWANHPK